MRQYGQQTRLALGVNRTYGVRKFLTKIINYVHHNIMALKKPGNFELTYLLVINLKALQWCMYYNIVQQAPFFGFSKGSGGGSMSGGGFTYSPSTNIRSMRSQTSCCSPRFHEYVVS